MARGRHALLTGQLLTKTAAIEVADAPRWLIDQMRARMARRLPCARRRPAAHTMLKPHGLFGAPTPPKRETGTPLGW